MKKVKTVKALPGYRLEVELEDGTRGTLSLQDELFGPVFEPLRDTGLFAQVLVDEFGVIGWPNGADLAPESVLEQLQAAKV
jgi:hypothetical protein